MNRMSAERIAADHLPDFLEPILRERIAGADEATVVNWSAAPQGFSTETFLFDLDGVESSEHGGKSSLGLVFRRPPEFDVLPEFDLRRQYLVMQRLAGSAVPVPSVRYIDADGRGLGTPHFVMDRVPDVLSVSDVPPYHQNGVFADTDDAGRAALWNGCVDMIATVHQVDISDDRFRFCDLRRFGGTPPERLVNFLRHAVSWAAGDETPNEILLDALDWLDAHLYAPDRVTLVWGDSRMSNILYGNDFDPVAVLDWEIAYLGDPAADIAWMYMSDWISSPLPDHALGSGTPSREETAARYRQLTGHALTNDRFHDVTAALMLAVPLMRLTRRFQLEGVDLSDICAQRIRFVLDGD